MGRITHVVNYYYITRNRLLNLPNNIKIEHLIILYYIVR